MTVESKCKDVNRTRRRPRFKRFLIQIFEHRTRACVCVLYGHREMWFPEKRKPRPLPFRFDQRATPSTQKSARPAAGRLFVCRDFQAARRRRLRSHVCVYVPAQCADSTLRQPCGGHHFTIISCSVRSCSSRALSCVFVSVSAVRIRYS